MNGLVNGRPHRLNLLLAVFLVAFLAVALLHAFWSGPRAVALAAREDNPRRVEAELDIQRGRILDENGQVVAETVGPAGERQRVYPFPAIGPAVGYYSFRHGTAGVEEGYDAVLRGNSENEWVNFWNGLLHRPQSGRDVQITLDANWQRVADTLLREQRGAAVLLSVPDRAVRVMVSHPGYDPNVLDAQFEALIADEAAPLLNRAAQGQYQPGLVLQPFLLAAAVDEGMISLGDEVAGTERPVEVDGATLGCLVPPEVPTWTEVLQSSCAGPLPALGVALSAAGLDGIFGRFGLTQRPELPLNTETPPAEPVSDAGLAAVGQESLTVTPLQVSLALAALADGGSLQQPQLVTAVYDGAGERLPVRPLTRETRAVSESAAEQILEALPRYDGLIAEYVARAVAGPEGGYIGWYLGLAPAEEPQYVVVIVVEGEEGWEAARRSGRALLRHILGVE